MSYDSLGRRTQMSKPNGVSTTYQYDSLSRLLSVLHGSIDGASYAYDAAGNRTSKQNLLTGLTDSYSYDSIYQLTQATRGGKLAESYGYDAVGNRTSSLDAASLLYNISNELTSSSNATFSYDANGNMLTKTTSTAVNSYTWDVENRLVSALVAPADPAQQPTAVSFKYDPFGHRISKSSASGTTIYAYDGVNAVAEYSASGAVTASYAQGLGVDEPLAMQRGGAAYYYNADGLGSITSLTNAAGVVKQSYVYDSFGNTTASTSLVNPYPYTAREYDSEVGLYYYRERYYDASIVGLFSRTL